MRTALCGLVLAVTLAAQEATKPMDGKELETALASASSRGKDKAGATAIAKELVGSRLTVTGFVETVTTLAGREGRAEVKLRYVSKRMVGKVPAVFGSIRVEMPTKLALTLKEKAETEVSGVIVNVGIHELAKDSKPKGTLKFSLTMRQD